MAQKVWGERHLAKQKSPETTISLDETDLQYTFKNGVNNSTLAVSANYLINKI